MKTISKIFWAVALFVMPLTGMAQEKVLGTIEAYRIQISTDKTTNIIFPFGIVSVDRGDRHILVQKAKGAENILQVKAANDSIRESNLSVITSDGKLNSFIVTYAKQPVQLNVLLGDDARKGAIFLSADQIDHAEILACSKQAFHSRKRLGGIHEKNFGIGFRLDGIFIHKNLMYFRMRVENRSNIGYDVDQLRFYILDQKKAKRTASQEVEVTPVNLFNGLTRILPRERSTMVVALPKFTIPEKKFLAIQLMEGNGGRHLELRIKNRILFKVNQINIPTTR